MTFFFQAEAGIRDGTVTGVQTCALPISVVAMGLPILTALLGLGIGISIVHVVASMTEIGSVAPVLATMIGLGVGIDYSLFIVTRYRENRAAGMELEAAVGR